MIEKREYSMAYLEPISLSPEVILSGAYDDELKDRMCRIIESEAPIKEALLYKRTINSVGLQKVGSRLLLKLNEIASKLEYESQEDLGEKVYYTGPVDFFRPTPDSEIRYSYQIPSGEGASCILYIIENGSKSSYTQKELSRLFMAEMGYQKLGAKVEELFKAALKDGRINKNKAGRIVR